MVGQANYSSEVQMESELGNILPQYSHMAKKSVSNLMREQDLIFRVQPQFMGPCQ